MLNPPDKSRLGLNRLASSRAATPLLIPRSFYGRLRCGGIAAMDEGGLNALAMLRSELVPPWVYSQFQRSIFRPDRPTLKLPLGFCKTVTAHHLRQTRCRFHCRCRLRHRALQQHADSGSV